MEDQIKIAHEILKRLDQEPTEENGDAICKATMDLEPLEAAAIMSIVLRIKIDDQRTFKSILLTIPSWVIWAHKFRETIDIIDNDARRARQEEIIQELELKNV